MNVWYEDVNEQHLGKHMSPLTKMGKYLTHCGMISIRHGKNTRNIIVHLRHLQ